MESFRLDTAVPADVVAAASASAADPGAALEASLMAAVFGAADRAASADALAELTDADQRDAKSRYLVTAVNATIVPSGVAVLAATGGGQAWMFRHRRRRLARIRHRLNEKSSLRGCFFHAGIAVDDRAACSFLRPIWATPNAAENSAAAGAWRRRCWVRQ